VRALVQRVTSASVTVAGEVVGRIGEGLCVFVGVARSDETEGAARMAQRLWHLRVFNDERGKPNLSAAELGRELLLVSQFTLCADTSRGRRPSYSAAAEPERAERLIEALVEVLRGLGAQVATGRFGAAMTVSLVNDGPYTLIVDT
jgi:D-tyrosyl-tRNA(Tyr) deacylase